MAKQESGKIASNIRLTPAGKMLLVTLGEQMGLTQSGVMETAIRLLAKEQGIKPLHFTADELAAKWKEFSAAGEAIEQNGGASES